MSAKANPPVKTPVAPERAVSIELALDVKTIAELDDIAAHLTAQSGRSYSREEAIDAAAAHLLEQLRQQQAG